MPKAQISDDFVCIDESMSSSSLKMSSGANHLKLPPLGDNVEALVMVFENFSALDKPKSARSGSPEDDMRTFSYGGIQIY